MSVRLKTLNVRANEEEKALWKKHAPNGQLSKWIRSLIAAEIERQKK